MKPLISVMLALFTLLAGCGQEVTRVEDPKKVEEEAKKPKDNRVVCYYCKGEQYTVVRSTGGATSFRQVCPVCLGRGFRVLKVPVGKAICEDCKGMGMIVEEPDKASIDIKKKTTTNFANKTTCARCIGSGMVNKVSTE